MPLSLTPKRAARILIINDESAKFSVLKSLLARSRNWKTATGALEGIDSLNTYVDASVTTRAIRSIAGHNIT